MKPSHGLAAATGAVVAVVAALTIGFGTQVKHQPPNLGKPRGEALTAHAATGCGVERWAVKTLTDPGASQVNLTPVPSTVAALDSLTPLASPTDRVAPVETTTYRLTGTIVFAKQEADGDIHLVLRDGQGNTMIVESPSPSCDSGSLVASQIATVRQQVDRAFPQAAQGQVQSGLSVPVTVTGVGFFDRLHGQTGVAPNGIELHPLLSFQMNGGS